MRSMRVSCTVSGWPSSASRSLTSRPGSSQVVWMSARLPNGLVTAARRARCQESYAARASGSAAAERAGSVVVSVT
ncbi:hypothetical protein DZF98_10810 [Clavibacter californiensis]|uniref:Uncharacterized protein n=1 Tax=Clavibacter californiensis TaxID=1401995 RepID=A0ABX9N5C2_9MICO|nr:hypothetical protein DZF98_10810 [Clavibacter californiensis]